LKTDDTFDCRICVGKSLASYLQKQLSEEISNWIAGSRQALWTSQAIGRTCVEFSDIEDLSTILGSWLTADGVDEEVKAYITGRKTDETVDMPVIVVNLISLSVIISATRRSGLCPPRFLL
jgi:hypothetical protein